MYFTLIWPLCQFTFIIFTKYYCHIRKKKHLRVSIRLITLQRESFTLECRRRREHKKEYIYKRQAGRFRNYRNALKKNKTNQLSDRKHTEKTEPHKIIMGHKNLALRIQ